jgi:hypothetical protein
LEHYIGKMHLKDILGVPAINYLVGETGKSLRKGTPSEPETRWSCDHLRGICREILLEVEWAKKKNIQLDINGQQFLGKVLTKVSGNVDIAPPPPLPPSPFGNEK